MSPGHGRRFRHRCSWLYMRSISRHRRWPCHKLRRWLDRIDYKSFHTVFTCIFTILTISPLLRGGLEGLVRGVGCWGMGLFGSSLRSQVPDQLGKGQFRQPIRHQNLIHRQKPCQATETGNTPEWILFNRTNAILDMLAMSLKLASPRPIRSTRPHRAAA